MTDAEKHLFVELCNHLRTARLSAKYYEYRLWWANKWHLFFEISIAVGATSSGIAGWALWKDPSYAWIWAVVTGTATLLSIIKPILAPGKLIEICTRQHQGWHALYFAFDKLMLTVCEEGRFSPDARKRFDTFYDRMVALHLDDEKCPDKRVLEKLQAEVNAEVSLRTPGHVNEPVCDQVSDTPVTGPGVVPIVRSTAGGS